MDDAMAERGALIRIQMMASKLSASHPTDRMDEVPTVKVLKPVLIRVMGVGTTVEVHRRRILPTVLIMSVLCNIQYTCNDKLDGTYAVLFLIEHERHDSPSGVGMVTSLATDLSCGTAPAVLILGARDGMSGHWHDEVSGVVDEKWR